MLAAMRRASSQGESLAAARLFVATGRLSSPGEDEQRC